MKNPNYTYERTIDGDVIVTTEDGYTIKIDSKPYEDMGISDIDVEVPDDLWDEVYGCEDDDDWDEDEKIIFYDGFAVNARHTMAIEYKTLDEVLRLKNIDWDEVDFYGDGVINFYQIQYCFFKKTILGKKNVEKFLESKRNTIKNKIKKIAKDNPNGANAVFIDDGKEDTLFNNELGGWILYIAFIPGSDMICCAVETEDRTHSTQTEIRSSHLKAEDWATILPKAYASILPL